MSSMTKTQTPKLDTSVHWEVGFKSAAGGRVPVGNRFYNEDEAVQKAIEYTEKYKHFCWKIITVVEEIG